MDDGWVCGSCHSINRARTGRCYSCRQSRSDAKAPGDEIPASAQDSLLGLGGAVTMVCPACGTPRLGWSRLCRSCGLSFDELAVNQVVEAASDGPGSLTRLLLGRLPVLIPGLLLLAAALVVIALLPSHPAPRDLAVPPTAEIWFGSSYSTETFELTDRRTTVRVGEPVALVAHLSKGIGPGEARLTAYRNGVLVANEPIDSIKGDGEILAGRLMPLRVTGFYAVTITDLAGNGLADGSLSVTQ